MGVGIPTIARNLVGFEIWRGLLNKPSEIPNPTNLLNVGIPTDSRNLVEFEMRYDLLNKSWDLLSKSYQIPNSTKSDGY